MRDSNGDAADDRAITGETVNADLEDYFTKQDQVNSNQFIWVIYK